MKNKRKLQKSIVEKPKYKFTFKFQVVYNKTFKNEYNMFQILGW